MSHELIVTLIYEVKQTNAFVTYSSILSAGNYNHKLNLINKRLFKILCCIFLNSDKLHTLIKHLIQLAKYFYINFLVIIQRR